jgi:hypothetical protein
MRYSLTRAEFLAKETQEGMVHFKGLVLVSYDDADNSVKYTPIPDDDLVGYVVRGLVKSGATKEQFDNFLKGEK